VDRKEEERLRLTQECWEGGKRQGSGLDEKRRNVFDHS